jgi:mono/diheme cytochrome c family protein
MSNMSIYRVSLLTALTLLIASSTMARKAPSGHDIFLDRCGACHGEDSKGNGPAVGMLKIAPADLTLLARRNGGTFPVERVKEILGGWADITAHGSREMPIWGDLLSAKNPRDQKTADEQFKSLVDYLESIQQ